MSLVELRGSLQLLQFTVGGKTQMFVANVMAINPTAMRTSHSSSGLHECVCACLCVCVCLCHGNLSGEMSTSWHFQSEPNWWTNKSNESQRHAKNPFYLDHVIRGSVVLWHNSPQNTSKPPAVYSICVSKLSLFLIVSSRVLITAVEIYMWGRGGGGGMVPHSRSCYISLGLLSAHFLYLFTEPSRAVATASH